VDRIFTTMLSTTVDVFGNVIYSILTGMVCGIWIFFGLSVRNRTTPGVSYLLFVSMGILLLTPILGYLIAFFRGAAAGVVSVLSLVGHFRKPKSYIPRVLIVPIATTVAVGLFLDYLGLDW